MTSTITSCQANGLLALQRSLSDQGFTLTITATPVAPVVRKTGKRRGRPPKSLTAAESGVAKAPTKKSTKRGMSAKGRSSIAASATTYHRQVKELREKGNLTLKQARESYRKLKKEGAEGV
jgi:hypothetical protein